MYQALYRKWRPQSFDDVVGQTAVTDTLKRQVETGRVSHAYLFVGTRGTGKTTCAKILAKAVNCQNPIDGNPCNKCPSCLGIQSGAILDVEEMDAASNNSVENIRALREEAAFTPAEVKKRVYIVDEVHMLSNAAFNALLKILEEPPAHLIFILATTELQKVPATILSRCQRFNFRRLTTREIASRLNYVAERENLALDPKAANMLARLADGAMRDGLSLLDQCSWEGEITEERVISAIGLAGAQQSRELLNAAASGDSERALTLIDDMYYAGKDMGGVLNELLTLCRDMLIKDVAPRGSAALLSGSLSDSELDEMCSRIGVQRIREWCNVLKHAISELDKTSGRRITAELAVITMCDGRFSPDLYSLDARIARLEAGGIPAATERTAPRPAAEQKPEPVFVPEPEPVWAAEPEAMPEPEPIAEPEDNGDETWKKIIEAIENKIDPGAFIFISDEMHTAVSISGGSITLLTKSVMARNLIDRTEVLNAVKVEAAAIMGGAVTVSVKDFGADRQTADEKLDALMKFGNTTSI